MQAPNVTIWIPTIFSMYQGERSFFLPTGAKFVLKKPYVYTEGLGTPTPRVVGSIPASRTNHFSTKARSIT